MAFLKDTKDLFDISLGYLTSKDQFVQSRQVLFRYLHTIKGNSKVLGFGRLGSAIHEVENFVGSLREKSIDDISEEDWQKAKAGIRDGLRTYNKYCNLAESLFKAPNQAKNEIVQKAHVQLVQADYLEPSLLEELKAFVPDEMLTKCHSSTPELKLWIMKSYWQVCGNLKHESFINSQIYVHLRESIQAEMAGQSPADPEFDIYENLCKVKDMFIEAPHWDGLCEKAYKVFSESKFYSLRFASLKTAYNSEYLQFTVLLSYVQEMLFSDRAESKSDDALVISKSNLSKIMSRAHSLVSKDAVWAEELINHISDVSLNRTLIRFEKMINSVCEKLSKRVRYVIEGDEVFVPQASVVKINDAMTHLLRNALDHGIESPSDRKKSNKSGFGTIRVRLQEADSELLLRIQDDGKE